MGASAGWEPFSLRHSCRQGLFPRAAIVLREGRAPVSFSWRSLSRRGPTQALLRSGLRALGCGLIPPRRQVRRVGPACARCLRLCASRPPGVRGLPADHRRDAVQLVGPAGAQTLLDSASMRTLDLIGKGMLRSPLPSVVSRALWLCLPSLAGFNQLGDPSGSPGRELHSRPNLLAGAPTSTGTPVTRVSGRDG